VHERGGGVLENRHPLREWLLTGCIKVPEKLKKAWLSWGQGPSSEGKAEGAVEFPSIEASGCGSMTGGEGQQQQMGRGEI